MGFGAMVREWMDAVGWMLGFLFFGMLANKKCWETRTNSNGEGGKRKKHTQSQ